MNLDDVRGKLDVLDANARQLDWLRSIDPAQFGGHRHLADLDSLRDALVSIIATHPDPPATP